MEEQKETLLSSASGQDTRQADHGTFCQPWESSSNCHGKMLELIMSFANKTLVMCLKPQSSMGKQITHSKVIFHLTTPRSLSSVLCHRSHSGVCLFFSQPVPYQAQDKWQSHVVLSVTALCFCLLWLLTSFLCILCCSCIRLLCLCSFPQGHLFSCLPVPRDSLFLS